MRFLPLPRSIKINSVSLKSVLSCGVNVLRASLVLAKAVTTREIGEVTAFLLPSSSHTVFMLIESLPTGMLMPSAGHNSMPTAFTVLNKAASSPSCPAGAIQLADNFKLAISLIKLAAILVIASPIAIRPEAGASIKANGARSPMAKASPALVSNPAVVTATSATGTCHGPTI